MPNNKRFKILHFEDDQMLVGMYSAKFIAAGMVYQNYPNPTNEPVRVVITEKPDLIIMGIIMPVMDGVKATRLLKSNPTTKNIPVVGLDNLGQKEDLQQFREAGMSDYLVMAKHTPTEVVNKIQGFLGLSVSNEKQISPTGKAWHGLSVQQMITKAPKKPNWWQQLFR